jgi:hypothetical protein
VRILLLLMLALASPSAAATFSVVNTSDTDAGSLRQAILDANDETTNPGADTIVFAIPGGGIPAIVVTTELPAVTAPLTIDGTTQQPGGRVELSGGGTVANGLIVSANNTTLRGLVVNSFTSTGITLSGGNDGIVRGCIVGLNAAANAIPFPMPVGILVGGSARTRIGGTIAGDRNVVSGNQTGIWLEGTGTTDTVIEGNYVGTAGTGSGTLIGNIKEGILLGGGARRTRIGGVSNQSRNIISANGPTLDGAGVRIKDAGTTDNTIQNNHIGTDPTGGVDLGNKVGVAIAQATGNLIADNLVSGNNSFGIDMANVAGAGNIVRGNRIGTNAAGLLALPNATGIRISNSTGMNLIGGVEVGTGNVIAFNLANGILLSNGNNTSIYGNRIGVRADGVAAGNGTNGILATSGSSNRIGDLAGNIVANNGTLNGADGITLQGGTKNTVRRNTIYANGGLGIDLIPGDGVTQNDAGDTDAGTNNLQNFPVLDGGLAIGATTASGTLDGTPSTTFIVDLYVNAACDPSGNGEAETPIGSADVATDATGHAAFTIPLLAAATVGQVLTATATDPQGNTSELSACTGPASTTTTTVITTTTTSTLATTTSTTVRGSTSTTVKTTTTTSTTAPRPTTTTLPPEVCGDRVDNDGDGFIDCADINCFGHPSCTNPVCATDITLPAMLCRVDAERGSMAAATDIAGTIAPAQGRLDKARAGLLAAQASCSLAKVGPARRRVGQASRLVRRAEAQLRKRGAKAGVPAARLETLAAGLTPLRDDLSVLRTALACP